MSAAPPMAVNKEQLSLMLHNILHLTDNNQRRVVEGEVMQALQHPATLTQLVHILCDQVHCPAGTRHLAAVLLRKRIFSLWNSLDASAQMEVRQLFITQLGVEETKVVRFAIAHIVTRLAKADAENGGGGWPELQQAIRVSAEDARPEMRELSMVLIYSFSEVFSEENALSDLAAESVVRGVVDSEEVVCRAAIKAGMMLLPCVHEKEALRRVFLEHLIPPCLAQLTAMSVMKEKVSLCVAYLDLLEQCLIPLSAKKQGPLLLGLVDGVLQVMANPAVHLLIRQNCGALLSQVVEQKPKYTIAQGVFPRLVQVAAALMSEDDSIGLPEVDLLPDAAAEEDDELDDDDMDMLHANTSCMIGCQLLSSMAEHVPSKVYTSAVLPLITEMSDPQRSANNPLVKKAAMLALACLAESNPSYLRRRMRYVLELTARYLQDPHPTPREAASASLTWFCLHLQPEILTHHAEIFPMLMPLLQDSADLVRRRAAQALDTLCEHTAEDLEPYVSDLVNIVLVALPTSSLLTQKGMCCVLSSIASAKTKSFLAFAPKVLELLMEAVKMTTPDTIPLRARATETVGVVGAAMGREAFLPYLQYFMPHVVDNFKTENPLLREYSFGFLSNMCEVLQQDFLPYVEDTIGCALHTIEQDRAVYSNKHLLKDSAASNFKFQIEDDGSAGGHSGHDGGNDEDEDDDAEEIHMRVRTADVEEKSAAVYAIGVFAESLRENFGEERLKLCWESLASLDYHFYSNIRSNALVSLAKLAKASHGSAPVVKAFNEDTLSPFTRSHVDDLMYQMLLPCIEKETEKDVVGAALEALTLMLEFFGPQCLIFGPDDVVKHCIQAMRVKLPCQRSGLDDTESDEEDDDDELFDLPDDDDQPAGTEADQPTWVTSLDPQLVLQNVRLPEDHDDEVLEGVMNVMEALFKAYGEQSARYGPYIIPLLLLYADPATRPSEDLVMSVGTMACLLESLGAAAAPFFDTAFQVALTVMNASEESSARSNAAYTIKVLLEHCTERFIADAALRQQTMELLWRIAGSGGVGAQEMVVEEVPAAVDNAVSATCSLVRCLPPELVPLDVVMPSVLEHVPMQVDKTENPNVVRTLAYLLTNPVIQPHVVSPAAWLPALLKAVLALLQSRSVEAKDKDLLAGQAVHPFSQAFPAVWAQHAPAELQTLMEQWRAAST